MDQTVTAQTCPECGAPWSNWMRRAIDMMAGGGVPCGCGDAAHAHANGELQHISIACDSCNQPISIAIEKPAH